MGNKNSSSPQDGRISDELRHNTSDSAQPEREIVTYEKLAERRSTPKSQNLFYKIMLTLNILAWIGLVIALILFHYVRACLSLFIFCVGGQNCPSQGVAGVVW